MHGEAGLEEEEGPAATYCVAGKGSSGIGFISVRCLASCLWFFVCVFLFFFFKQSKQTKIKKKRNRPGTLRCLHLCIPDLLLWLKAPSPWSDLWCTRRLPEGISPKGRGAFRLARLHSQALENGGGRGGAGVGGGEGEGESRYGDTVWRILPDEILPGKASKVRGLQLRK